MRLCPLRSPSSAAEVAAFSEECLEANKLQVGTLLSQSQHRKLHIEGPTSASRGGPLHAGLQPYVPF